MFNDIATGRSVSDAFFFLLFSLQRSHYCRFMAIRASAHPVSCIPSSAPKTLFSFITALVWEGREQATRESKIQMRTTDYGNLLRTSNHSEL